MSQHRDDGGDRGDSSAGKRQMTHGDAIAQAGARLLHRAIAPYGVLDGQTLKQVAGAGSWPDDGFAAALSAAVDAHDITPLPLGFYEDSDRARPTHDVADATAVADEEQSPPRRSVAPGAKQSDHGSAA